MEQCWPDREYIGTRLSDLACLCLNFDHFLDHCPCWMWATNTNTNMDKHKYKYKYGWIQIQIQAVPQVWSLPWPFVLVEGQTACSPISFTWNKVAPWSSVRHELQTPCMLLASNLTLFVCLTRLCVGPWLLGRWSRVRQGEGGKHCQSPCYTLYLTPYSLYTPRIPWTCF